MQEDYEFYKQFLFQEEIQPFISLFNNVWSNEGFQKCTASSSKKTHHYGYGGLARHTQEVVELSMRAAEWHNRTHTNKKINLRDMFFAALYHDFGKLKDYEPCDNGEWRKTEHKVTHHHVFRSALDWYGVSRAANYPKDSIEAVGHAILAHHNLPEWGSAVSPQTPLALILHTSDYTSAHADYMAQK